MSKSATSVFGLAPGDRLVADGGFTCMSKGDVKEVKRDAAEGFYVDCADGKHFLDGQVDDWGTGHLIGLRKAEG
jgi:hypothetical protein